MKIHKKTKLLPHHREAIWRAYHDEKEQVSSLARRFQVSRPTIYNVLKKARQRILVPLDSTNTRFNRAYLGIRRLAKVEREIEERKKKQAKRYNKRYPGEMLHVDTKRLPLLSGQSVFDKREYLFVGIDDFSRELYAAIMPDKTASSAAEFLQKHVIEPCPYTIECVYSDNGREYQGTEKHEFAMVCD